jgi:hypothetical protein
VSRRKQRSEIDAILIRERWLLRKRGRENFGRGPLTGLALSGGGIRSGIFNLGLLTALERKGLVNQADFLSTVSGGGYIGSYVIANRMKGRDLRDDSPANPALGHLRKFGDYLTPSVGAMSADTWSMMMVWFRNTSVLQLFLLSVFAVLLLLPRLWAFALEKSVLAPGLQDWAIPVSIGIFHLIVAGICAVLIRAFRGVGGFRARAAKRVAAPNPSTVRRTVGGVIVLALAGSTLFAVAAFAPFAHGGEELAELKRQFSLTLGSCGFYLALFSLGFARGYRASRNRVWVWAFGAVFLAASISVCAGLGPFGLMPIAMRAGCAGLLAAVLLPLGRYFVFRVEWTERAMDIWRSVMAGAACGGVSYGGLLVAQTFHGDAALRAAMVMNSTKAVASEHLWTYALFAAPGLLATLGCCIIFLLAVAGRAMPDLVREAWSRLGALLYMKCVAMLLIGVIGVYGPLVILTAWVRWNTYVLASGGVATAVFGILSLMAANGGNTGNQEKGGGGKAEILAKAGPPVFIVLMFCVVSMAIHGVFVYSTLASSKNACQTLPAKADFKHCDKCVGLGMKPDDVARGGEFMDCKDCGPWLWNGPGFPAPAELISFHWQFLTASIESQWGLIYGLLSGLVSVALFLMGRLDVNEYSINRFYRNRLARCFIGAARAQEREPNPVTGFDGNDDVQMEEVAKWVRKHAETPVPILNTALNAVGGTNAQMEERRAESFFVTPMAAYSGATGALEMTKFSTGRLEGDVTLGSLVAISGAAANPNMGFHTESAVAFLLTFFNVRLGWWAGVPQRMNWWKRQFNLSYVFFELFGTADTDDAYVNLSDGGHFENLGIYELVRRRCRLIIVGDGEQDGDYIFESLGMAIRRCRIDFDVDIQMDVSAIQPKEKGGLNWRHFVVGKINYPGGAEPGYLVYVKSSFTGREPYDVKQYRYLHPDFPQQSTGDQFFDESQFESYRQLGLHAGEELVAALGCGDKSSRMDWMNAAKKLAR